MLSVSDREKLLNWDAADASEEPSNGLGSSSKEQVDFIKAAPSLIQEQTKLTLDAVLLFISAFLPPVVSLPGPKTVTEIRTANSTLCRPAFFPVL